MATYRNAVFRYNNLDKYTYKQFDKKTLNSYVNELIKKDDEDIK